MTKKVKQKKVIPKKILQEKIIQEKTTIGRYRIADKSVAIGMITIWSLLMVFGIFTLTQPQWLVNLSSKGRAEEALTNITAGNTFLYQGKEKKSEENLKKALANYQKALEIDPSSAEAMANMGITYLYLNKLDEAKATFEKSLKTDTMNDYHTYIYLGDIYERKGEMEKALENYLLSLKKHPDPSYPLRKAGLLSERLNKPDDAVKYLKQSIELTKSFENLYKFTLIYASYKLTKDNDTLNLKIIKKELQNPDFTEDVKRYDRTIFEHVLKSSDDLGYAYMYLANAYFMKSEFDSAYANYQLSSQHNPTLIEKFKPKQDFAFTNMNLKNEKK